MNPRPSSPRLFAIGSGTFGAVAAVAAAAGCVPPGNSTPSDAGATATPRSDTPAAPTSRPSINVMTSVFEDGFDRPAAVQAPATSASSPVSLVLSPGEAGAIDAAPAVPASTLGPNWSQTGGSAWQIENGRLCGKMAHNHGVWLQRTLPVNARIEFDAIAEEDVGDLKAEAWGDGRSSATSLSYTNATSYLTIFGGWKNTFHVLARLNEHGTDRKEIKIDKTSDDPTEQPVTMGQVYHFKIERTDGKTVRWAVNGVDYLSYQDSAPLVGFGHDHFGFNDWEAKVCFDNVKVTPLP